MGTLQTTIKLNDQFSNQLAKINRTMQSTARAMASLQKAQLSSAQLLRYEELKTVQAKEKTIQATIRQQTQEARRLEKAQQVTAELNKQKISHQGIFDQMQLWASRLRNIMTMYFGIRTAIQGINRAVQLSDKMTMTDAKFNLVAGGDKKLAGDLKEKTFAAAQRSTTDYLEFGKAVGKLGILAGDKFKNQDSIVRFVELMNKSFQISGADTSERNAAMLQITQAIASNRLQGDEFRSILENAPMVMQSLTKSLGVGHDKLKAMAKEGKITADVLIKAMFDAGERIENMYSQLDMTWERHWAKIKNVGVLAFQPIQEQLKNLFNSEKFQAFVNGLCTAMIVLGNLGGWALEKLAIGANVLIDGFMKVKDVLITLIIATGLYGATVGILSLVKNAWLLVTNATQLATIWSTIWQAVTANAALLIVAAIALIILWVYKCSDSWADAIGKIVGVVMQGFALIWNIVYGVISAIIERVVLVAVNRFIDIWEFALNTVGGGFDNFGDWVKNLIGNIISWFLHLGKVVTTIIDAIFGTNWTAGLNSLQKSVTSWGKNKNAVTLKRYSAQEILGNVGINRWAYSDAYDYGYKKGSGAVNAISKGLGNIGSKLDDLTKVDLNGQKLNAEALNGMNDKLGDVGTNTGNTANNTGDIAKNTGSTEDYSYLRNWAYNKGMGNSIGYNIKIEQNNKNNIGSNMDLNRVVDAVRDAIIEGIMTQAEGVR